MTATNPFTARKTSAALVAKNISQHLVVTPVVTFAIAATRNESKLISRSEAVQLGHTQN